ncbi:MAG: L-aspartate oxidase [Prolixibacteraceae bacterium]|jgi:L-aspartate oxidase|nr:L-aspartate oxidase [Prolixibacteraceae bacterium]
MKNLEHDFVIVGSGLAGLAAAYYASQFGSVAIITKAKLDVSNSYYAQGGIAAVIDPEDEFENHIVDTLTAGRGICDRDSVEILVKEGRDRVLELIEMGMHFDKEDGEFVLGLEGGHSKRRILHSSGASTGRDLTKFMVNKVKNLPNVTAYESTKAVEMFVKDNRCYGIKAICFDDMSTINFKSNIFIISTGGLSRLFQRSTNPYTATGDGIALAWNIGAKLVDMEFIQFHPSALMIPGHDAFLLSEAIRGEGAYLLDKDGTRFMEKIHPLAELAPRDIVASAIYNQMKKDKVNNVFLSMKHLNAKYIKNRFSNIYSEILSRGIDITSDLIPIAPAAHYMVGGIQTGLNAETNIQGLWACGEVASTGVMGANRLASNSLLECLVFAKRAVENSSKFVSHPKIEFNTQPIVYKNKNVELFLKYKNEISDIMSNHVSLVRNGKDLEKAVKRLKEIHDLFRDKKEEYNFAKINNIADISFLIARSALIREESRGGHVREDFPSPNPNLEVHIVQQRNQEPIFEKVRK